MTCSSAELESTYTSDNIRESPSAMSVSLLLYTLSASVPGCGFAKVTLRVLTWFVLVASIRTYDSSVKINENYYYSVHLTMFEEKRSIDLLFGKVYSTNNCTKSTEDQPENGHLCDLFM